MDAGLAVQKARSIVEALAVDDPKLIDVEAIAMLRGLVCVTGGITGAEGRLVRAGVGGIIRVGDRSTNEGRRRFTIAHEIGHFELHRRKDRATCAVADLNCWGTLGKEEEYQANVFAAELLMPDRLFAPHCRGVRPGLEQIQTLATLFQTSLTATAIRFVDFCPEECALVLSQEGRIRWSYIGPQFRFRYIGSGMELDGFSLAHDYFHGKPGDRRQQHVDASAWFPNIRFRQDAVLQEQSWSLGDYAAVLTLLWIDEDI